MTRFKIALLTGDGIGPEISNSSVAILKTLSEQFHLRLDIRNVEAGDRTLKRLGKALPQESIDVIETSDVCLKGPVGETAADVIVKLRQLLDLYANLRPAKAYPQVSNYRQGIDLLIVRENTEDLYRGHEFEFDGGAVALRLITKNACSRIAEYAFRMARERGLQKRVIAVHTANVLRKTDGLFSRVCREVASRNVDIDFNEMYVDAAAMNLIRNPNQFDVLVTTNLYGDILSDEAAQLVGGLGVAPSANVGDNFALFEPVHGSAPDIAGKGIANPLAMLLCVKMMMDWWALKSADESARRAAEALEDAVLCTLARTRTPDLGGNSSTREVTNSVIRQLKKEPRS